MYLLFSLTFIYLASGTLSSSLITPCKVNNFTCIKNSVNAALPLIFDGMPEIGVESSDPLFVEIIEVRLPTLNYTIFNSTVKELKLIKIANLTLSEDITTIHCDIYCPNITLNGQYDFSGELFSLPLYGKGDYQYYIEMYLLKVVVKLDKVAGDDGNTHLFIKEIKIKAIPLFKPQYEFKNLFNGQKDLVDDMHKFVNENWRMFAELFQDPIWYAIIKKVTANVNKYLENISLQDTLLI